MAPPESALIENAMRVGGWTAAELNTLRQYVQSWSDGQERAWRARASNDAATRECIRRYAHVARAHKLVRWIRPPLTPRAPGCAPSRAAWAGSNGVLSRELRLSRGFTATEREQFERGVRRFAELRILGECWSAFAYHYVRSRVRRLPHARSVGSVPARVHARAVSESLPRCGHPCMADGAAVLGPFHLPPAPPPPGQQLEAAPGGPARSAQSHPRL